jgi:hypothetical protein
VWHGSWQQQQQQQAHLPSPVLVEPPKAACPANAQPTGTVDSYMLGAQHMHGVTHVGHSWKIHA